MNYLKKVWRGEERLWLVFWVYHVLACLVLVGAWMYASVQMMKSYPKHMLERNILNGIPINENLLDPTLVSLSIGLHILFYVWLFCSLLAVIRTAVNYKGMKVFAILAYIYVAVISVDQINKLIKFIGI